MNRLRDELGAAAVETAFLVTLVLLPLVIGTVELGFAFNEWLSVTSSTREGARTGAAAGDLIGPGVPKNADCLTLEATAGALQAIDGDAVFEVWIYKSDTVGSVGVRNRYRPSVDTDTPASLFCTNWVRLEHGWPVNTRANDIANRDYLGVKVIFDHTWVTNLPPFSGSSRWQDDTVMRIEPDGSI